MKETWFVAGGAGFIGSNFVRQQLQNPALRIVTIDNLTYAGSRESLPAESESHRFVQCDIGDSNTIRDLLLKYQPHCVVNFAAESHVDRSIEGPRLFFETNVMKTLDFAQCILNWWRELAAGLRKDFRFLQISTDEVFGTASPGSYFDEVSRFQPNSPYAASKAAADHALRALQKTFDLPVLTTHCSNNYGPYQHPEKLIPLMILKAIQGEALPIYGDGLQIRDWIHVEDHCRALKLVLERGQIGESYLVGAADERTNLSVVESICDILDESFPLQRTGSRRSLIHSVSDRPGHDQRYAIDSKKIRKELGWRPQVEFERGLRTTIDWYREHPDWVEQLAKRHDLGRRQGLGIKRSLAAQDLTEEAQQANSQQSELQSPGEHS